MPDTEQGRVTLAVIQNDIQHLSAEVRSGFAETNRHLRELNGAVVEHETRVTVVERFCNEQVKPLMSQVNENRVELARVVAKWGSIGVGGGGAFGLVVFLIGKSQGLW